MLALQLNGGQHCPGPVQGLPNGMQPLAACADVGTVIAVTRGTTTAAALPSVRSISRREVWRICVTGRSRR